MLPRRAACQRPLFAKQPPQRRPQFLQGGVANPVHRLPAAEAVGGPLLDLYGHVVAILGGSLTPGARFEGRAMNLSAALFNSYSAENAATPFLPFFDNPAGTGKTLDDLAKDGP